MRTDRSPYALFTDDPPPGAAVVDVDPFCVDFFTNPYPSHEVLREADLGVVVSLSHCCGRTLRGVPTGAGALARILLGARGGHEGFRSARAIPLLEADPPPSTHALARAAEQGTVR